MTPRTRLIGGGVVLALLAVLTVLSLVAISPPAPKPADAPADEFSAGRAFQQVEAIGQQVHPAGSDGAAQVRGHIVDRLDDLGYDPQVVEGIGQTDLFAGHALAHVQNVVTVIPGSDSTGRLILMAHYDSVQVSYGANDDGSGVASLLETARALAQGPQLRNDVILLFTDAEEACLCGAESFVHNNDLAADGGVVLNFESRGASGPPVMFETAAGNSSLIAQYAAAVPYPVATSMAVEVYRIMPNDTDFTTFLDSGRFTGLNSANIDGSAIYHTPEDKPEYMDRGTLQAQGSNALALARQLGDADLTGLAQPASGDATDFPVLGALVHYPGWLVWPLTILALLAVAGLAWVTRRRLALGWGRLAGAFGMMLVPLAGSAIAAQLFWVLLTWIRPAYGPMIDPWHPGAYRLAVCALVAFIMIGWYAWWRRKYRPSVLMLGGFAWLALLGVVMAIITPGGSYLAVLPALAGAVTALAARWLRIWWARLALALVAGIVGVLILAPTVSLFFPALGLATGAAAALMAAMLGLALLPAIEYVLPSLPGSGTRAGSASAAGDDAAHEDALGDSTADWLLTGELPGARPDHSDQSASPGSVTAASGSVRPYRRLAAATPALVALALVVGCTVVGLLRSGFDADHPKPTQLMYALNTTTDQAYWASEQSSAHGWLAQYVGDEQGEQDISAQFPLLPTDLLVGDATAADLPAPELTVDKDSSTATSRTLTVTIEPQRGVRLVTLDAPDISVRSATVSAGDVSRTMDVPDSGFHLVFHAPPADGVTVTMVVDRVGPIDFTVAGGSDGLGQLPGFTRRPPDVGIQGSHTSELLLTAASVTV